MLQAVISSSNVVKPHWLRSCWITHSTLIDEILDLHDRMIGSAFAKAKRAYETSFREAGTAINEKVRLYAQVGQALIEAKNIGSDPLSRR
jgi:hypothetical protein